MLLSQLAQIYLTIFEGIVLPYSKVARTDRLVNRVLKTYPLIDQHVDLPVVYRVAHRNDISHTDYNGPLEAHVDLARLKEGGSGGFFSIAFVPCYGFLDGKPAESTNETFTKPNNMVRDTLEQIDVTKQLTTQYSEIALATSAVEVQKNFKASKISHLIGIEGAHSLGNSLAALRMYYDLGVRYLTLTHTCHNAFADASGSTEGVEAKPLHHGLSELGERLVLEMNRIGMMVDLSHTSDDTARQAIALSKAPVFFSHSGARAINNHVRNIPDDILESINERNGRDSFVGITFLPDFVSDQNPTIDKIADHIEHVAKIAGKSRVGIGSDFDGFQGNPIEGMEDVSHYKSLLIVLANRGWSEKDLAGLTGGNFLRVFKKIESVSRKLKQKGVKADTVPWTGRPDLKGNFHW